MRDYDFEKMHGIWKSYARTITAEGIFVANDGNWDFWFYSGIVYAIPVKDSGCAASTYCSANSLRQHLHKLRRIIGYSSLIPPEWKQVNH